MQIYPYIYKCFRSIFENISDRIDGLRTKNILRGNGVVFKHFKSYGLPIIRVSMEASCILEDGLTLVNRSKKSITAEYRPCKIIVRKGASLYIGKNVGITGSTIYASSNIHIGNNVKIGGGNFIFDTNFHCIDPYKRRECHEWKDAVKRDVTIEDDVFIGYGCIICKGVRIGFGSVIAAGSVITKDIPPMEVWGGNPAKFIKKLSN